MLVVCLCNINELTNPKKMIMQYSVSELKEQFKKEFIKGTTTDARTEMKDYRFSTADMIKVDEALITTAGGYYVVLNEDGERLFDPMFEGNQDYPNRLNTFSVYEYAKQNGHTEFKIFWQTDGRYFETYADKRNGHNEPLADGTSTLLLRTIAYTGVA
tara:strand:+ start:2904 stop:3377 length:474 start_codon:yes stop_codon:yes gene_type:complete